MLRSPAESGSITDEPYRNARLEYLLDEKNPFYLAIMPYAPHVANLRDPPTPQTRHAEKFADVQTPRQPCWNPPDDIQKGKSVFLKNMKPMDAEVEASADRLYRDRLRSIQGVDEIIEDVIRILKERGQLENTYGM
jgi:arylsulfatase A-like enzyme